MISLKQLLAARGIHFIATRFGWRSLRGRAFDAKYRSGDWLTDDGAGEAPAAAAIGRYLRGGDLLLLGCGQASILNCLARSPLTSALGVDLSDEALHRASRFRSDKITFAKADMTSFICPIRYDVILFSESFYYVPAGAQVSLLRRLSASLKPGGVIAVTFAQAKRYAEILDRIRHAFEILEDHAFQDSGRHLIIFR